MNCPRDIAQGYAELGLFDEALTELNRLSKKEQKSEIILSLRISILMKKHDWKDALKTCEELTHKYPSASVGYLHGAYCLHELKRTPEAKEMLLNGPPTLLQEPTYFYNLGCYDATLGQIDQALRHLETSFEMDHKFREMANSDPDLKSIRSLWSTK